MRTNWIKHPLVLEDKYVRLVPLAEEHFEALSIAAQDETIWTYMPVKGMEKEKLTEALKESLLQKEKGEHYPFAVLDKTSGKILGSTRFLRLNEEHLNLEIGWTWFVKACWGKGINESCKLLLLRHCFETLKCVRVQIVSSEKNTRSRKAIVRIGATFEGVLRDMIIRNGEKRSVAFYSILEDEWPVVKAGLEKLIEQRVQNAGDWL